MIDLYYVEDDPGIAGTVKEYLEQKGFRVTICATFARAKQALQAHVPALVLLDWNMPDGRGDSLCQWIRSCWKELPIIFLTVRELQREVRPQADYRRSLDVLRYCREKGGSLLTKTGFMVGLGETEEQIEALMDDVLDVGVDILTIGQYLQPSPAHYPLARYASPEDFERYKAAALAKGFRYVASAPLARSSYKAWEALESIHDLH